MSGFEAQVRVAVEGGEQVVYSSVPVYRGADPVPLGISLHAQGSGGFQMSVTVINPAAR